jgi:hypothetical protein
MTPLPFSFRPATLSAFQAPLALLSLLLLGDLALAKTPPKEKAAPAARRLVGRQEDGSVLVTTNQIVTPLGLVKELPFERPKDLAISPDASLIAVLTTAKVNLFKPDGTLVAALGIKPGPLGLAWHPDGQTLFASGTAGMVYRVKQAAGKWTAEPFLVMDPAKPLKMFKAVDTSPPSEAKLGPPLKPEPHLSGLAVAPDGQRLYVGVSISNAVAVYDLTKNETLGFVPTGLAPYRILLSPDGKTLYTANRGGRAAQEGEPSATSARSKVRVDPETDAALRGSLSIIDTEKLTTDEVDAGRQPAALAFSWDAKILYVAQSDEDSIGVFDPGARKFVRTISLQPPQDPGFGQMPNHLALAGDGKRLFVTCGGINAVAELDLASEKVTGYFPTSWYPIALGEKAGALFVASSKGYGAQARAEGAAGLKVSGSLGTMQFITPAQQEAKSEHTRRVALNNSWGKAELPARPDRPPVPVPDRVGEPSVFKHVVFIIKENHTYDIDLGDIKEGNGDPALCMFGEAITPNEHALARQWVLLDNTYTSGTNSADGHQWTVSSVANSYMEQNFLSAARSYPYDGGDPLAYSPKGFLWNAALKAGKTVRVYGEFVNKPTIVDTTAATKKTHSWKDLWDDYRAGGGRFQITAQTENAALRPHLHPNYIGFPITVSDQWRADQYLAEFKTFVEKGTMPDLTIMLLPADHTTGAKPGLPTPRAAVADNDLALGRVVDAISHSPFWKETLILVIEDDSQFGLDHVDGHRTVAFCVSPYTRRGAVVSEVYNHTSFIRTMGLVLGLPAMNRFDRTATPMTSCFTSEPDVRPYEHKPAGVPLDEMNPPVAALKGVRKQHAIASSKLDLSDVDRADATVLARAVWDLQRPGVAFPVKKFHPNAKVDDD